VRLARASTTAREPAPLGFGAGCMCEFCDNRRALRLCLRSPFNGSTGGKTGEEDEEEVEKREEVEGCHTLSTDACPCMHGEQTQAPTP